MLVQHTTPHSTTGVPPAELLFGRNLEDKLPGFVKENEYQYEGTVEEDALMKKRERCIRILGETQRREVWK